MLDRKPFDLKSPDGYRMNIRDFLEQILKAVREQKVHQVM